jgi:hypothetical protein
MTKIFHSEHNLDFEAAPWEFSDDFKRFRIGTCEGLYGGSGSTYDILAIENTLKGNGHLQDVLQWFEYSCKRDKKALRILEVWNQKFALYLIRVHGFKVIPNTDHLIKHFD